MRPLRLYLIMLLLGWPWVAFAQAPALKALQVGSGSGYNVTDPIMDVQVDRNHQIWVISTNHITRFNGTHFTNISTANFPHDEFLRFHETPKGLPYVVDLAGRIFFVENDTIRPYRYNNVLDAVEKLYPYIDVHFDRSDRLHMSHYGPGYLIIDAKGALTKPYEKKRNERPSLFGHTAIFGTGKRPFISHDIAPRTPNEQHCFSIVDASYALIDTLHLQLPLTFYPVAVVRLSNGNFLLSYGADELIEFNETRIVQRISYGFPIVKMFADRNHGIWISTAEDGIHYYKDENLQPANRVNIGGRAAYATTQDHEGGIWYHSGQKLFHIPNPSEYYYNKQTGHLPFDEVYGLEVIEDHAYVATPAPVLSIIDLHTFQTDSLPLPPKKNHLARPVNDIHYDSVNQRIWIAERHRIYYRGKEKWHPLSTRKLLSDRNGAKFFLRSESIDNSQHYSAIGLRYHQLFMVADTSISYVAPLAPSRVFKALVNSDSIWLAGANDLYLQSRDTMYALGDRYPDLAGNVQDITWFNGKIWFSVQHKGTFTLDKNGLTEMRYQGIRFTEVRFVKQYENRLWVLAKQGSFCYETAMDSAGTPTISCQAFRPVSRSSVNHIESTDSTIYFGTFNEGVKCLDFHDLQQEPLSIPILSITKLRINNRDYPVSDSTQELNHDEDFLQISYVGTSYQAGNVVYRYRLNGLRDNWTITEETYTQFTSLPPGDYAFEIQAQMEEQAWSASKFIHFRIAKPFWWTWWFILASALGASALAYAIINYRIAMINREKSLIIKRLTAEQKALSTKMDQHLIFNIISSAQYLISEGLNEKADHFLEKFAGLMRKTLDQTNRQSVSIEDEIQFLMEYLEMEQVRLEGQFEFQLTVDPTLRLTERIPNFIVQPIVENAIEHGIKNKPEKGRVSVKFLLRDRLLKVVIEDNGIGYNQSRQDRKARHVKRESHGIATIRERLKLNNGKKAGIPVQIRDLSLEGPHRSGTQVTLSIKLNA